MRRKVNHRDLASARPHEYALAPATNLALDFLAYDTGAHPLYQRNVDQVLDSFCSEAVLRQAIREPLTSLMTHIDQKEGTDSEDWDAVRRRLLAGWTERIVKTVGESMCRVGNMAVDGTHVVQELDKARVELKVIPFVEVAESDSDDDEMEAEDEEQLIGAEDEEEGDDDDDEEDNNDNEDDDDDDEEESGDDSAVDCTPGRTDSIGSSHHEVHDALFSEPVHSRRLADDRNKNNVSSVGEARAQEPKQARLSKARKAELLEKQLAIFVTLAKSCDSNTFSDVRSFLFKKNLPGHDCTYTGRGSSRKPCRFHAMAFATTQHRDAALTRFRLPGASTMMRGGTAVPLNIVAFGSHSKGRGRTS